MNQSGGCRPDVVAVNVLIGGLCREGRTREAAALMEELAGDGLKLNRASYRILMNRLCEDGDLDRAAPLLGLMLARGVLPHFATSNALLVKLCDAGRMAEAGGLCGAWRRRDLRRRPERGSGWSSPSVERGSFPGPLTWSTG
ncbi:unnamed protein product [Spirodela intermedia]|uniref:Uncharacterized protein n=1 Tax=Spirodela intermedia TaxID=51605 RepID=A0A7I8J502_SPIIN|nr:unnamed protein product [Spirodela intermedia]CAA6665316.1 unnamed protein product [Spirodela intermedia]